MAKKGFLARSQAEAEQLKLEEYLSKQAGKANADLVRQAEDALRALRSGGAEERRKAADALERALRSLGGQKKPMGGHNHLPEKDSGARP